MITYSDLCEELRKEKYNDKLQGLPKNFLKDLNAYFNEKKAIAGRESDEFNDEILKTKRQIENAKSVLRELMRIRQRKILSLALVAARIGIDKRDTENMLEHEKELLTTTAKKVEDSEKKMNSVLNGATEEKDLKNILIKFNEDVPQFAGADSETFGPFKKGDVANLSPEIANILVDNGQASLIEQE